MTDRALERGIIHSHVALGRIELEGFGKGSGELHALSIWYIVYQIRF